MEEQNILECLKKIVDSSSFGGGGLQQTYFLYECPTEKTIYNYGPLCGSANFGKTSQLFYYYMTNIIQSKNLSYRLKYNNESLL